MPAASNKTNDLMQQFKAIDAYLQAVHEILQEGHLPDIAGLDERVAQLCLKVEKAPPSVQKKCLKMLDELLSKLNACEDKMMSFQKAKSGRA